ncbi:hypothetical protein, partial [Chloroflexus sp.]|uniref:hypothetical protein n=1 Tax=Chloroflexus sp. TaxID=1904827 RepID=UPI002ADE3577
WQRRLGQVIGDTRNVARTACSRVQKLLLPHLINVCNKAKKKRFALLVTLQCNHANRKPDSHQDSWRILKKAD